MADVMKVNKMPKSQAMKTLADFNDNTKLVLMIIGPPSAGKSISLLHMAQFIKKPLLYVCLDGRFKSTFRYLGKYAPHLLKRIRPKRFTMKQYDEMSTYLEKEDPNQFGAVQVDPLWGAGAMMIEYSMDMRDADRPKGADRGVIMMPQMDDYKVETRGLNMLLDYGAQIPGHFLMGAHYLTTWDSVQEVTAAGKVVTKKVEKQQILVAGQQIAAALPGLFDEVWFQTQASDGADTAKAPKRVIYMAPSMDKPFLKTSSPDVLPGKIEVTNKLLFDVEIKPGFTIADGLGLVRVEEEEWEANNPSS